MSASPRVLAILSYVAKKLCANAMLKPAEMDAFLSLPLRTVELNSGSYMVREGDRPDECCAILSGFAFRHKSTGAGDRQILAMHLRGDLVDLENSMFEIADHNVQALTRAEVAYIPKKAINNLIEHHPALGRSFLCAALVDSSLFREWIVNVGRRDARQRVAHLVCEVAIRQVNAGLCPGPVYEWPFTQEQVADCTGLTPVHVNRMLKQLRTSGLIMGGKSTINIPNLTNLEIVGDFSRDYLH